MTSPLPWPPRLCLFVALGGAVATGLLLEVAALERAWLFSLEFMALPGLIGVVAVLRARADRLLAPTCGNALSLVGLALVVAGMLAAGMPLAALFLAPLGLALGAWALLGPRFARQHWLLWTAGLTPAVLGPEFIQHFDPMLMNLSAHAAAGVFRLMGFEAYVDGVKTIVGLGVPLYVNDSCAGVVVMSGAFVASVIAATCFVVDGVRRVAVVAGFQLFYFLGNLTRIVSIGVVAALHGREPALAAHDPIGYVISLVTYGSLGLALWVMSRRSAATLVVPAARRVA